MKPTECYRVLGLSHDAEPRELHRAFKRLVLRYHPDRCGDDPVSRARFCEVTEAYAVLKRLRERPVPTDEPMDVCPRCDRVEPLFRTLGGGRMCADCLLNRRRRLLPMTLWESIRCVGVMALQALALYFSVSTIWTGDLQHGAAAMACALGGFGVLAYHAWQADVVER